MCFERSGPQFAIANFTGRRPLVAAGADDGLFDFPARQYSAYQGRWLTPDPAGAAAAGLRSAQILRICLADPRTWNEYAYVGTVLVAGKVAYDGFTMLAGLIRVCAN